MITCQLTLIVLVTLTWTVKSITSQTSNTFTFTSGTSSNTISTLDYLATAPMYTTEWMDPGTGTENIATYKPWWSLFTFGPAVPYNKTSWTAMSSCSLCETQVCGEDCPNSQGATCTQGGSTGFFKCFSGTGSYCYSIAPTMNVEYNALPLILSTHMIGSNYTSPVENIPPPVNGASNYLETIVSTSYGTNFSTNAYITSVNPSGPDYSQVYYLTSEQKLIYKNNISTYDDPPVINSQWDISDDCTSSPFTATVTNPSPLPEIGYNYFIISGPGTKPLTTLIGTYVLSTDGVVPYQTGTIIIDPCNGLYITLTFDGAKFGNLQSMYNMLPYICVAIQDTDDNTFLHLYQVTPAATSAVTPSSGFIGLVSPNYIAQATVRQSTGTTFTNADLQALDVTLKMSNVSNSVQLNIVATAPVSCTVSVSPNYTFSFSLTGSQLVTTVPITSYLPAYDKIFYQCGVLNDFYYVPNQWSLMDLYVNSTDLSVPTTVPLIPMFAPIPDGFGDKIESALLDWTPAGILIKVIGSIMLLILGFVIHLSYRGFKHHYPTLKKKYEEWKGVKPVPQESTPLLIEEEAQQPPVEQMRTSRKISNKKDSNSREIELAALSTSQMLKSKGFNNY